MPRRALPWCNWVRARQTHRGGIGRVEWRLFFEHHLCYACGRSRTHVMVMCHVSHDPTPLTSPLHTSSQVRVSRERGDGSCALCADMLTCTPKHELSFSQPCSQQCGISIIIMTHTRDSSATSPKTTTTLRYYIPNNSKKLPVTICAGKNL